MQTRVAVRAKTPHRFQVIPLREMAARRDNGDTLDDSCLHTSSSGRLPRLENDTSSGSQLRSLAGDTSPTRLALSDVDMNSDRRAPKSQEWSLDQEEPWRGHKRNKRTHSDIVDDKKRHAIYSHTFSMPSEDSTPALKFPRRTICVGPKKVAHPYIIQALIEEIDRAIEEWATV